MSDELKDNERLTADAQAVYEWMRKPDWDAKFGTKEILDWIERRPIPAMVRIAQALGGKVP